VKVVIEVTLVHQDQLGQLGQVESKALLGNRELPELEAQLVHQDQLDQLDLLDQLALSVKEETLVLQEVQALKAPLGQEENEDLQVLQDQ
jgi:hypothetical protein